MNRLKFVPRIILLNLFLVLMGAAANASPECLKFSDIPKAFMRDLALDEVKSKLRFRPLRLGSDLSGFLVQDDASCSLRGSCDSALYLARETGCYRPVVTFRGRWQGLESESSDKESRTPASFRVQADDTPGSRDVYRFDVKSGRYRTPRERVEK